LPLTLAQVRAGKFSLARAVEMLTAAPARCLRLRHASGPLGTLAIGSPADISVIDLEREEILTPERILSKSKNTPFMGWKLKGLAVRTFVGGREVYRRD